MPTPKYYPPLTDLIDASALPGDLQALENALSEGISVIIGKIYYKDFSVQVLKSGESKFYNITLLTKAIRLPLVADMNLVFFKGNETTAAEFQSVFQWTWPLAKYFPQFDALSFSSTPEAFLDILIELSEITSREEFFGQIVKVFLDDGDDAYVNFVTELTTIINGYDTGGAVSTEINNIVTNLGIIKDEVDAQFTVTNLLGIGNIFENYKNNTIISPAIDSIENSLNTLENDHGISIDIYLDTLNALLLNFTSDPDKFERLFNFFRAWLNEIDSDDLQSFLIPQIRAGLKNINVGLEFPRTWLIPMIESPPSSGTYIEDPNTANLATLEFTVGDLIYSTRSGFTFNNISTFNFERAMIAHTGVTLEITDAKIDVWENFNIPEANNDGRPDTFKGIFIDTLTLGLPPSLTKQSGETTDIVGNNLLIGTEGGVSGHIYLDTNSGSGTLKADLGAGGAYVEFTGFDIVLRQNSVTNFSLSADLFFPGFKDSGGSDQPVGITGSYAVVSDVGEYTLTATSIPTMHFGGMTIDIVTPFSVVFDKDGLKDFSLTALLNFDGLTNGPIDITIDYVAGAYSISSTSGVTFNVAGTAITISNLYFLFTDGTLASFSADATILFPGQDTPFTCTVSESGGVFTILSDSAPSFNIGDVGVAFSAPISISFDDTGLNSFDLSADVTLPGVASPMTISFKYDDPTPGPEKFSISGTGGPTLDFGGLEVTIDTLGFEFTSGTITGFAAGATVLLPGAKDDAAGTNDLLISASVVKSGSILTITALSLPDVYIEGMKIEFNPTPPLEVVLDNGVLQTFSFGADITIDGLADTGTPLSIDFAYDSGLTKYTVTATNAPTFDLFGLGVKVNSMSFELVAKVVTLFTMDIDLTLPSSGDVIKCTVTKAASQFDIAAYSIPTITIGGLELTIATIAFGFDGTELKTFSFTGDLLIPGSTQMDGTTPQPLGITLSKVGPDYQIEITSAPPIYISDTKIELSLVTFNFTSSGITAFTVSADVSPPGAETPIGPITASFADNAYSVSYINASPTTPITFLGQDLYVTELSFSFDGGALSSFTFAGNLELPGVDDGSGGPAQIGISIGFTAGSPNMYEFHATSTINFELFGIEMIISSVDIVFEGTTLTVFGISGVLETDALKDSGGTPVPLAFDITYQKTPFEIRLTAGTVGSVSFTGIEIGSMTLELKGFTVVLSDAGLTELSVQGFLTIPNLKEGNTTVDKVFEFDFLASTAECSITVADPLGLDVSIGEIIEMQFYKLKIGYIKDTGSGDGWLLEIGKDANDNGFFIEQKLDIPLVGKFIPTSIDIPHLYMDTFDGIRLTDAEFALEWEGLNGLEIFGGNGQIGAVIPVNKTILDAFTIKNIRLLIEDNSPDPGNTLSVGIDATLTIGPFAGVVENAGVQANVVVTNSGGNLGPVNVDQFKFKPPTGIGLSIDAKGFTGGGFISFDPDKGQYAGILELDFADSFAITAIALLTTKLPDGSKGLSLLVILTAEFATPIQLGYGFTLSAVGGLLGLNRTMVLEVLRTGVKDGSLDNILFPDNPVENATQLISDLRNAFPVDKGRFVFGPMAIIGWGTPNLIALEVGLLIEVPSPVRIAILGVIKAILPDEEAALIKLQINFLGTIDFGKKFITFDASIFDSRVLTFVLTGDMAFRLKYGSDPAFVLTVGGFHPDFKAPTDLGLPSLARLGVQIINTSAVKVGLESYFAVTANTVQFGAKIFFYAKVGPITAEGHLGFDVLFQFSPFYFVATLSAGVSVKWKKWTLMAVTLNGKLEGPTPWRIQGKATFTILKWDKTFNLKPKEFGQSKNITYPTIDILPLLEEALNDDLNWDADIGQSPESLVSIKPIDDSVFIINAKGALSVRQKVVPLGITIEKYGNKKPGGGNNYFTIGSVSIGIETYTQGGGLQNIKDSFAPAEYKNLSDSKKLSTPSFQNLCTGVSVTPAPSGNFEFGNHSVQKEVGYDTTLIDSDGANPLLFVEFLEPTKRPIKQKHWRAEVRGGAAGRSRRANRYRRIYGKSDQRVGVSQEKYAVVNVDDLLPYDAGAVKDSQIEAEEYMQELIAGNPTLRRKIQVTPEYSTVDVPA